MPIDPDTLSSFASEYAKGMTSIRGRRVQRLLKREFAGAEYVLLARAGPGPAAVLGLSASGAALCATDGRGRQARVVKWLHGSGTALETHFDLHKDSLPTLTTQSIALAQLRTQAHLQLPEAAVPAAARPLVHKVLRVLAVAGRPRPHLPTGSSDIAGQHSRSGAYARGTHPTRA